MSKRRWRFFQFFCGLLRKYRICIYRQFICQVMADTKEVYVDPMIIKLYEGIIQISVTWFYFIVRTFSLLYWYRIKSIVFWSKYMLENISNIQKFYNLPMSIWDNSLPDWPCLKLIMRFCRLTDRSSDLF